MSRLTSLEKGGFYAVPPEHEAPIVSLFGAEKGARLLDPCAGEGDILERFWKTLSGSTVYANELDSVRAARCVERFGPLNAVQGDLYKLKLYGGKHGETDICGLVWCNPPYAWDSGGRDKRREFDMLMHAWKWAQPGGYVAWCVYLQHVTRRAAEYLCKWADLVEIWRLPGLHLNEYRQVVVVARVTRRKQSDWETRAEQLVKRVTSGGLPDLTLQEKPHYVVPAAREDKRFVFAPENVTPDLALLALQQTGGSLALPAFQERFTPPPPPRATNPVVRPRGGQLGLWLASGVFTSLVVAIEGQPVGVRATVEVKDELKKVIAAKDEDSYDIGVYHEKPEVTLALLSENGKLEYRTGDTALIAFIREQKPALLRYVEDNFKPQYDFTMPASLRQALSALRIHHCPLLEAQKHVVAAMHTGLDNQRSVVLVGEMGTGKTAIALSLIATRPPAPGQATIILCPPHLTRSSWLEEAQMLIPDAFVRILTNVEETAEFFRSCERGYWVEKDKSGRELRRVNLSARAPRIGIVSFTGAKLKETWEPAVLWQHSRAEAARRLDRVGARLAARHTPDSGQQVDLDRLRAALKKLPGEAPCCPTCGAVVYQTGNPAAAGGAEEGSKKEQQFLADARYLENAQRTCRVCGSALWQESRKWSRTPHNPLVGREPVEGDLKPRNPRTDLADFIAKRWGNLVGRVVCDEFHEAKSRDSALGRSMLKLFTIKGVEKVGLTGTLSNGLASGLYVLLFAISEPIRKAYPWGKRGQKDASKGFARWCRTMGRMEKLYVITSDAKEESGAATGIRRHAVGIPKEIPGTMPALMAEILDRCLFLSIADMGKQLPPFTQEAIAVPMDDEMEREYVEGQRVMKDYLTMLRRDGDNSFTAQYRQSLLAWPTAAWREEIAAHQGLPVHTLPSLGEDRLFPKEDRLLDLLRTVIGGGGRAIVFVRQTGERNIQPRLADKIHEWVPGAVPHILPERVKPADRVAYIRKVTNTGPDDERVNVLISNPNRLKTGVTLLDYPVIIFIELDDSYQTMGQAARRSWRLGQTQPCSTYYFYYTAGGIVTMEHAQAIRTAKKEIAAAFIYGDAATDGLAEADESGDDTAMIQLVDEFNHDTSLVTTRELFAAVNAQRSAIGESAWDVGDAVPEGTVESTPERALDAMPESVADGALSSAVEPCPDSAERKPQPMPERYRGWVQPPLL